MKDVCRGYAGARIRKKAGKRKYGMSRTGQRADVNLRDVGR